MPKWNIYIYILYFLLIVGICNVLFVTYMLFKKCILNWVEEYKPKCSVVCVFKLSLWFLVHCSDLWYWIEDCVWWKWKQGGLGRGLQTQIDLMALTAVLKRCLSCVWKIPIVLCEELSLALVCMGFVKATLSVQLVYFKKIFALYFYPNGNLYTRYSLLCNFLKCGLFLRHKYKLTF